MHGELRVAHFDAHLVFELLQPHLGLTIFQLGAYLVGLRGAVAQRDGQAQSDAFIRSAGVEKLPDSSSDARAGRNIGGLSAERVRRTCANPRVRIKRAAQPGAAIVGKQSETRQQSVLCRLVIKIAVGEVNSRLGQFGAMAERVVDQVLYGYHWLGWRNFHGGSGNHFRFG